jgi:DNA-3-methyladenine glycosylase I
MPECNWPTSDELMQRYHDEEWGKPRHSDKVHFEFLILEGAQAGLSWRTILHKREGYRRAFYDYDWRQVASMTEEDAERLLNDPGIIRNRMKIRSAINNAKRFAQVVEESGSFDSYLWHFTNGKIIDNSPSSLEDLPSTSELSDRISKDLKARGFTFVGSTVIYAHLQAVGIVNDHLAGCSHKY